MFVACALIPRTFCVLIPRTFFNLFIQSSHSFTSRAEGDPCFGTIISGEDVVDRINALPVNEGDTDIRTLKEFVFIVKAVVVSAADIDIASQ